MNTQKQIFLIVVLFFAFVGGCAAYTSIDLTVRAPDQEDWHFEESVERGALLFANNCRTCHGNAGEGGVGPALNRADFKNQDPLVLTANQELIRRTVACGRAGTRMPAWLQENGGPLNSVQVEHIVNFLTAPENATDEEGNPTSKGWLEAVEFAHNLNHETAVAISGDTLSTIAEAHGIGYRELAELNGLDVDSPIDRGDSVRIPSNLKHDEESVNILKENQDVRKVANSYFVGAAIIADLNGLNYDIDYRTQTFTLLDDQGDPLSGLLPGEELELPDGAVYVVRGGDTIQSIADLHSISPSQLRQLNDDILGDLENEDPIDAERKLVLPPSPIYIARAGDTYGTIASQHGVELEDLEAENAGINTDEPPPLGAEVRLPAGTRYTIQRGDTLETAARKHGVDTAELARLNDLDPNETISPEVVLELPKIDAYVVQGQSLEEVAEAFANVTAESLAEASNVEPDAALRVGTPLSLPEEAWGTAPSGAINPGTACVQYAVPNSVFEQITGEATPPPEVTPPTEVTNEVRILATQKTPGFDWTFVADGTELPPNEGVVLMDAPATITFENVVGLHTITVNGEKDNGDFGPRVETRTLTFEEPGEYYFTCDYHPDMKGWVFLQ